jgi:hypothetical protein
MPKPNPLTQGLKLQIPAHVATATARPQATARTAVASSRSGRVLVDIMPQRFKPRSKL